MDNLNSVSPRKISLFVFDFDGTLVDTLADIADSVNLTLRELGLSTLEVDAIKDCVGRGVVRLMTGALKGTGYTALDHAVELFRKHYSEHLVEQTDLYPNCRETLEYFSDKTHAIFSNKPDRCAASMEYAIIGFPQNNLMFLPGILLLPPLAGIMAIQLLQFTGISYIIMLKIKTQL